MSDRTAQGLPAGIPGPAVGPLLGRLRMVVRFGRDTLGVAGELFRRYGRLAALAAGGGTRLFSPRRHCPGSVLVYGPELVREVATNHDIYHKFPLIGRLYPGEDGRPSRDGLRSFGAGLFAVNGDEHRRQRKLIAPAFYNVQVATYRDDMVQATRQVLDAWPVGEVRNVARDMQYLAKTIASRALFGEDLVEQGDAITSSVQGALHLLSNPLARLLPFNLPGLPYRRLLAATQLGREQTQALIARRRAAGIGKDMFSLLLRARDEAGGLSEEELIGHAGVLFAAGHETSANALTWTLLLLSQYPDVTADLCDELRGELKGEPPTVEQLDRLPLLDHVVKESLRIIPPVPWNGRLVADETELGGHPLPAGCEVMASLYHTHHMPELFPEPESFRPRRWETIHPTGYEYNPFSAGPRICIGAGFALLEIRLVLSMLLQRFRLEYVPRQRLDRRGTIVLTPSAGLTMRIHPADGRFHQGVGHVTGNVREMVTLPTAG